MQKNRMGIIVVLLGGFNVKTRPGNHVYEERTW